PLAVSLQVALDHRLLNLQGALLGLDHGLLIFFMRVRRPRRSPLFPYTTLFRSAKVREAVDAAFDPAGMTAAFVITYKGQIIAERDRKSTRLNSSHVAISYAVLCLKKKTHPAASRVRHAAERPVAPRPAVLLRGV